LRVERNSALTLTLSPRRGNRVGPDGKEAAVELMVATVLD
jgi:hypothetical protein